MAEQNIATPAPEPAPAMPQGRKLMPEMPKGLAGFDPLRPLRMAKGFVTGTFEYTLNNTSDWGRKAMKLGALAGLAVAFAPALGFGAAVGGITAITGTLNLITGPLIGALAGWAAGAVGGAAVGAATGGIQGMWRVHRGEKYSEDLRAKEAAKNSPRAKQARTVDYRDVYRQRQAKQNFQTGLIQEQQRQFERDERNADSYWRDFVSGSQNQSGRGF